MTLASFRPGSTITEAEYADGCNRLGFAEFCRQRFGFTEEELVAEYLGWKEYIKTHIPAPYPGIDAVIRRQKALGGRISWYPTPPGKTSAGTMPRTQHLPDGDAGWDLPESCANPATMP